MGSPETGLLAAQRVAGGFTVTTRAALLSATEAPKQRSPLRCHQDVAGVGTFSPSLDRKLK